MVVLLGRVLGLLLWLTFADEIAPYWLRVVSLAVAVFLGGALAAWARGKVASRRRRSSQQA